MDYKPSQDHSAREDASLWLLHTTTIFAPLPIHGIDNERTPMRLVVINLARADARRQRAQNEFDSLGLAFEFHEAVDGRQLQPEHYAFVDRETRRRLGLWPRASGSIANWFSQRQVMQQIVDNGPDMVGMFEDDVSLAPDLPEVLAALERKPFNFDIVGSVPI